MMKRKKTIECCGRKFTPQGYGSHKRLHIRVNAIPESDPTPVGELTVKELIQVLENQIASKQALVNSLQRYL